jgi:carboxylesterase type B
VTLFDDPLQRIRTSQIAQVPILLGSLKDDGTVFALAELGASQDIPTYMAQLLGPLDNLPSSTVVQASYPGLSNAQVLAAIGRDIMFRWHVLALSQWTNLTNRC